MLPTLTFVLGGAASGKSRLAESLVENYGGTKIYLATAQIFDAEMQSKVDIHQSRRLDGWETREVPHNVAEVLAAPGGDIVLFDCATLWLSNQMMQENADLVVAEHALLEALAACPVPVVMVSNEVGQGIVPENALARRFREAQGRLNIALAAQAGLVIHVVAGLPHVLKGQMP